MQQGSKERMRVFGLNGLPISLDILVRSFDIGLDPGGVGLCVGCCQVFQRGPDKTAFVGCVAGVGLENNIVRRSGENHAFR